MLIISFLFFSIVIYCIYLKMTLNPFSINGSPVHVVLKLHWWWAQSTVFKKLILLQTAITRKYVRKYRFQLITKYQNKPKNAIKINVAIDTNCKHFCIPNTFNGITTRLYFVVFHIVRLICYFCWRSKCYSKQVRLLCVNTGYMQAISLALSSSLSFSRPTFIALI